MLAKQLHKEGRPETAVRQFAKHGTPNISSNFEFYDTLARSILQNSPSTDSMISLKDMLLKLVNYFILNSKRISGNGTIQTKLEKYLYISHLKCLKEKLKGKSELALLVAKQSISLLRYTNEIRPDIAFFEAGQAAKVFQ